MHYLTRGVTVHPTALDLRRNGADQHERMKPMKAARPILQNSKKAGRAFLADFLGFEAEVLHRFDPDAPLTCRCGGAIACCMHRGTTATDRPARQCAPRFRISKGIAVA